MDWHMIGHEWARDHLQAQLDAGRLRHAYLFAGPDGVGKGTLAIRLAQALLCEQPTERPCFACRGCLTVESRTHPDLHWIESAPDESNLKIESIRAMQREIVLSPYQAGRRVVILRRAHELTTGAANALLKTLEEPPDRVVLVLTSRSVEAMPETVGSRCEVLRLRTVAAEEIQAALRERVGEQQADVLTAVAGGRPGRALAMAEDGEDLAQRREALEAMLELLGSSRHARFEFAKANTEGRDPGEIRSRLADLLSHWLSFWRDVALKNSGAQVESGNPDFAQEIEAIGESVRLNTAVAVVTALQNTMYGLSRYANTQLALEALLLQMPDIPTK